MATKPPTSIWWFPEIGVPHIIPIGFSIGNQLLGYPHGYGDLHIRIYTTIAWLRHHHNLWMTSPGPPWQHQVFSPPLQADSRSALRSTWHPGSWWNVAWKMRLVCWERCPPWHFNAYMFWHIFCDMLSDILSDILSIFIWHSIWHSVWHLALGCPAVPTEIWLSPLRSGWDLELAVDAEAKYGHA